jgi:hypothetical protein
MASLRCVKTKDILNCDQRTNYLKSKNLYITATNSGSNDQFIKNSNQCLVATNSYQNRYDISKGHNLVQTQCAFKNNSIQPSPLGKLNEGNFLCFTSLQPNNKLINSTTAPTSGGPQVLFIQNTLILIIVLVLLILYIHHLPLLVQKDLYQLLLDGMLVEKILVVIIIIN